MTTCTEIAIFKVPKANLEQVIALSFSIVDEINADGKMILTHEILQKTNNAEEICWSLTWINQQAVALSAEKWATYPSTKALESLVADKVYYGHFVSLF